MRNGRLATTQLAISLLGYVSKIVLHPNTGVSSVQYRYVDTASPQWSDGVSGEPGQIARR
ncbi:MAG: hypothetical protein RJB41_1460 [Actinomycetota bacterium]|jgi:hypothetical protein